MEATSVKYILKSIGLGLWITILLFIMTFMFILRTNEFWYQKFSIDIFEKPKLIFIIHAIPSFVLVALIGAEHTLALIANIAYLYTKLTYYGVQKYTSILEKPSLIRDSPTVLIKASLFSLISIIISTLLFTSPNILWSIPFIWLFSAIITIEMKVKSYTSNGLTRKQALYTINGNMGRISTRQFVTGKVRYPFP